MLKMKTPAPIILSVIYVDVMWFVFSVISDLLVTEETIRTPANMDIASEAQYKDSVPVNPRDVHDADSFHEFNRWLSFQPSRMSKRFNKPRSPVRHLALVAVVR